MSRVLLVTGASKGLGQAIAGVLAQPGALVIVHYCRDEAGAGVTKAMLKERGGDALVLQADLTEAAEAAHLVEEAKKGWDPGGTGEQRGHSPKKAIPGDHRRVPGRDLATNVKAVFCLSREATKGMSRRGRGCIINASSISGSLGFENRSAYCALKGAVNLLTRAMALELGPMGIRVNAVAPRVMNTGQVVANLTKAGMLEETSR